MSKVLVQTKTLILCEHSIDGAHYMEPSGVNGLISPPRKTPKTCILKIFYLRIKKKSINSAFLRQHFKNFNFFLVSSTFSAIRMVSCKFKFFDKPETFNSFRYNFFLWFTKKRPNLKI